VLGSLAYTISETDAAPGESASTPGQIVLNVLNTAPDPAADDTVAETYQDVLFQGAASVIATDELGGGRGSEPGLINGQTNAPGQCDAWRGQPVERHPACLGA